VAKLHPIVDELMEPLYDFNAGTEEAAAYFEELGLVSPTEHDLVFFRVGFMVGSDTTARKLDPAK
jgi:hypothetical protein